MKTGQSNFGDSTSRPERTSGSAEPGRAHLGRRALIRGGAIGLAGALSGKFPQRVFADNTGAPFKSIDMPFLPNMVYGMGVDVVTGRATGRVTVDPGQPQTPAPGLEVTFHFDRKDSQEEVFKAIGINLEASGHYGFFSGAATFDFTNQLTMSRQSTHLLVQVTVKLIAETLASPRLIPEVLASLKTLTPDQFRDKFGDGFVSGMQKGGEYYALYSIFSDSLDIQESTVASLRLDFNNGLAAAGGGGKLSETTKELLKNCELSIFTYQRGGDAEGSKPATDPQAIMTRAINFPTIVAQNPVPYAITVSGYNSLPEFISNQQQIEARQQALGDYARTLLLLQEKRDDVTEELTHKDAFVNVPRTEVLDRWSVALTEEINNVRAAAIQCADTGVCPLVPFQLPADYQDPVRPAVVVLFEKETYAGIVQYVKSIGWYDHDAPEMGWIDGGHLFSIKVPQGLVVRLYSDWHFQADHLDITESQPALGEWRDRARSLVVYSATDKEPPRVEQVIIFSGTYYSPGGGAEIVCSLNDRIGKTSLNIDPMGHQGWFDRVFPIQSIKVPTGMKVTVWENTGFSGAHYDVFNDMPYPEPDLGRPVGSSMRIFRLP